MLVQFSLTSAEARLALAEGFWSWPVAAGARRVVVCRSSTCAALMVARWPEFPWESFAAGITWPKGVCVNRVPGLEAVVRGDAWSQEGLGALSDLGAGDLIVKSGNLYDGSRVGVLLGSRQGYGTIGRIYPSLGRTGIAGQPLAPVVAPMLSEKLVPPEALVPSGYPDSSLGWASRLMVYRPDHIFDERDALALITGGSVRLVGGRASADGYAVTTYHAEVSEDGARKLFALVDRVKGAKPVPFSEQGCDGECQGCTWGGRTTWRPS
ncbi:MAG: hypothetical protein Q8P31_07360 [Bacillota bacterium]|nr:hypothetical protein [Bacillota bacterium]